MVCNNLFPEMSLCKAMLYSSEGRPALSVLKRIFMCLGACPPLALGQVPYFQVQQELPIFDLWLPLLLPGFVPQVSFLQTDKQDPPSPPPEKQRAEANFSHPGYCLRSLVIRPWYVVHIRSSAALNFCPFWGFNYFLDAPASIHGKGDRTKYWP